MASNAGKGSARDGFWKTVYGAAGGSGPSAFVGRDKELEALQIETTRALLGSPRLLAIEAEAGMGKTSLLNAFLAATLQGTWSPPEEEGATAQDATPSNWLLLKAWAEQDEMRLPFGMIRQISQSLPEHLRPSPSLLGPKSDPFAIGSRLLETLQELSRDLAVLLVLEDMHFCDEQSGSALLFLLRRIERARILTIATVRAPLAVQAGAAWQRLLERSGTSLRLGGLDAREVLLLAEAYGRRLAPQRAAQLQHHTGGNPLWLRALFEELPPGLLEESQVDLPVPQTLASTIAAQHASLSKPARKLAAAAAILGNQFQVSQAAQVAGIRAARALEELVQSGLVVEQPMEDKAGHRAVASFRHPLLRAAILDSLAVDERSQLHSAAASNLSGPRALDHLAAACRGPSDAVAAELEAVGRSELASGALQDALGHLDRAWQLTPAGPARVRRARLAMDATLAAGAPKVARNYATEILQPGQSADSEALFLLGWLARHQGHFAFAEDMLVQAAQGPMSAETAPLHARIALERSLLAIVRMSGREAVELATYSLSLAPDAPDAALARALEAVGMGLCGQTAQALERLGQDLPAGMDLHALMARGVLRLWSDNLAGAHEDLFVAVQRLRDGEPMSVMQPDAYLAETCYRMGRLDEAGAYAEPACEAVDLADRWWELVIVHTRAGFVSAAIGDFDSAHRHARAISRLAVRIHARLAEATVLAQQAHGEPEPGGSRQPRATARPGTSNQPIPPEPPHGQGETSRPDHLAELDVLRNATAMATGVTLAIGIASGSPKTLAAAAEPAMALAQIEEPGTLLFGPVVAEALIGEGNLEEARRRLDAFQARAEKLGRKLALMHALRVRGMLHAAQQSHDQAKACFEGALAIGRGLGMPIELARAHLSYASALSERAMLQQAKNQLRAAKALLEPTGALAYLALVSKALQRLELEQRRQISRLTPAETRIARLATEGLTNSEIAEALSVKRKTVEYHLSNVYAKLAISSRSMLASLMEDSSPG